MGKSKDCVVYSHLKAFGKKGKTRLTEKLAILQYPFLTFVEPNLVWIKFTVTFMYSRGI